MKQGDIIVCVSTYETSPVGQVHTGAITRVMGNPSKTARMSLYLCNVKSENQSAEPFYLHQCV